MATGYLLPLMNALQSFTNQGVILAGGKIYTYLGGTTTPVVTYTDSTLGVSNGVSVTLDSSGRPPNALWVPAGQKTKFIVKTSAGVQVGPTVDYVPGVNDPTVFVNDGLVSVVTNVQAFKDLPVPTGAATVAMLGYYAENDGGGGDIDWVPSSTATVDNGSVFSITANGSNPGRGIRRRVDKTLYDIREYGGIEGQTTTVNTNAFVSCLYAVYHNTAFPAVTTPLRIRISGTYTIDPTLLPYQGTAAVKYQKFYQDGRGFTLELGGQITFSSPYYVTQGQYVRGLGSGLTAQFQPGGPVKIIGDMIITGSDVLMENILGDGQLWENGHASATFGTVGLDANVRLVNVAYTNFKPGNTTIPALRSSNKYWVQRDNCHFAAGDSNNFATPSISVLIESDFESGIMEFRFCTVAFGNVVINLGGAGSNFGFVLDIVHESSNQTYALDIAGAGASGQIDVRQFLIADPQVASSKRVTGLITGVKQDSFNSTGVRLSTDDDTLDFFEYSYVMHALSNWRRTRKWMYGDKTSLVPSITGLAGEPGYVRPNFVPILIGAPPAAGWSTVANGGKDGVVTAYTKAGGAGLQVFPITNGTLASGAFVSGDVIVVGMWIKRTEQSDRLPKIKLQLLGLTDTFSGTTTAPGEFLADGCNAMDWDFGYAAFKVSTNSNVNIICWLETGAFTDNPLTISGLYVAKLTGSPSAIEVHDRVNACQNFDSVSNAASGSLGTYFSWPTVTQLFGTDVGLDPRTANALKVLGKLTPQATSTAYASMNLPTGAAPTSPADGDVWREDNTNTGLKIRINGVTKTVTVT